MENNTNQTFITVFFTSRKMDFLEFFPEEICDEIFSYLNARDIKKASLLSKNWYNTIGRSKICMKKLRFAPKSFMRNDYILNSSRQYQKMKLLVSHTRMKENTKYLRLMRDIVSKFSESLVNLHVSHDLKLRVDLPKLTILKFHNDSSKTVSLIASNGLLTKTSKLMKLTVNSKTLDNKSIKFLKEFLTGSTCLKFLETRDLRFMKEINPSQLNLSLEEFHLMKDYNDGRDRGIVGEFFKTQAPSLETVEYDFAQDSVAFFMSNLPKLQTLILHTDILGLIILNNATPVYPVNETITKLTVRLEFNVFLHPFRDRHLIEIISKLENLQEFEIDALTPELLQVLFNCRFLKIVRCIITSFEVTEALVQQMQERDILFISRLFDY